ncbi:beta-L-arabinofuranosidase domain-containing protein [Streptomyces sp. VRA16 Mangrove soil]|uniref:beta-L-arabinofuranosidase domain-containing protein n=1 Tax=Streptomyces sp. VRA16 Mangrove soil TaxID=2817434 RepID=UPI001A9EEEBA|nr:beta-L-arabinofuranosidase domain-containing protein [Streptomyces sp. VRA16 Mangrove soil]MBO1330922.1 glycoside hydrolase family 127 protein [Streptomyces sp. VRA16 Mangrove soil]
MAPGPTRRTLLSAAALGAAELSVDPDPASAAPTAPTAPTARTARTEKATTATTATSTAAVATSALPFALDEVALGKGVFAEKSKLMLDFGRGYDEMRLIQVFRANAGLPTPGAVAPGGWEGLDGEANGNLRGHTTGHFLTMLAQAYASTGDEVYADKIRTMVGELHDVRAALRADPVVLSVDGRSGGGAVSNIRGSYQYVELPGGVLDGASDALTLAAWVRPEHADTWARVADFGDDTTRYLYLAARNGSGHPRFAVTTSGVGGEQAVDGPAPLPVGAWSHLAVTLGGGSAVLYVDGAEAARNDSVSLTPAALGTLKDHWLGRSHYAGDPVFAGALDEVHLWSRVLSADEIAALHAGESGSAGDLAAYGFDETSGSTFADASGNANTATLRRTWGGPSHPGFLAAYPETQFILLESMTSGDYTKVWAPYYTAHKILRGLVDAHLATGDTKALDLAAGMCDWMYARLSKLPATTLQRMWGIFSSGEFGGIVEAIVDLYALSGDPQHLALARLFHLDRLIDACAAGTDTLSGIHANQHIPIFTGLLRLYDETGEGRCLAAARNFWDMVVPPRMYAIGGTSDREFWGDRGVIASTLSDVNAETCCAYNMLKLSRLLFLHDQDPKYMEYYERALLNQVLGSKQDKADAEKPLVTYFIGLRPGHVRDYTPKAGTTCCEGTGLESATKYQDTVYVRAADDSALFVNLYTASTLKWSGKGVTVTQTTDFPREQGSTLTVRGRAAAFALRLRVPAWAVDGFRVTVNGQHVEGSAKPGTYLTVQRVWRDGDVVRIAMPFRVRVERTPDDPHTTQALFYGPVNLVARDARTSALELGLYRNAALSGDLRPSLRAVDGKPLHFTLDGTALAPFLEGTEDPTHAYFHRAEPAVVFGGTDSGVANPVKEDGSSFLDAVWAAAPFGGKGALVAHVRETADVWTADGLLTAAEATKVVDTARRASYRP